MKIFLKKIIQTIAILTVFFASFSVSLAANEPKPYTFLQELPGIPQNATLSQYLPAAFNLAIGIAVAMAFIYITIGGVMYATSDAISGKSQGKEYITNALYGLLLVIGSYVILYTIDPAILNLNLSLGIEKQSTSPGVTPVVPGGPSTGTGCSNCVSLSSAPQLPTSGTAVGSPISTDLIPKLTDLNQKLTASNIPWTITEAYSYDPIHVSTSCHHSGTCVDAKPINQTQANIESMHDAAVGSGLSSVTYEVQTISARSALVNGCSTCNPPVAGFGNVAWITVNPAATGPHFHLVK